MRIDGVVEQDEVCGDLLATRHGYQSLMDSSSQTFDRIQNHLLMFLLRKNDSYYCNGGFNGGKTEVFMKMADTIAERVDEDLKNNVVALWHDESHMNRYLIDNPPTLDLDPTYCYAEEFIGTDYPFNPGKIIALKKITMNLDLREIPVVYINLDRDTEKEKGLKNSLATLNLKQL